MGLGKSFGEQSELDHTVLANVLDDIKPLYQLAVNFNWRKLERDWSGYFSERTGRTSESPRLIAGLSILSYLMKYSDEEVVEQFTQNLYYQFLCGEIYFTRERPCDPSCLSRWRKTLGQEGIDKLLAETIALEHFTNK